jgi:hypothetical protein
MKELKTAFKNYIQGYVDYADQTTNYPMVRESLDGYSVYTASERKENIKEMALRMAEADFETEFVYGRKGILFDVFVKQPTFDDVKKWMEE